MEKEKRTSSKTATPAKKGTPLKTENSAKPVPLDLETLTEKGYDTVLTMVKDLIGKLEKKRRPGDGALSEAITALKGVLNQKSNHEVLLAMLGEMGSGKTSLINAALGYPLFPVAEITTSACPVEIRYGKKFKLQVFAIKEDQEEGIFTFDTPGQLLLERRQELLHYAQTCVTSGILVCENFDYYFDICSGQADLNNVLHCAQLLIALINGYLGQDYENPSSERQALIEDRERLLRNIIGEDKWTPDTDFGIRIWIDSDILKRGLTLVDLPGLGSDTATHTEITTDYISRAHCCVMLFGLNGNAADNRGALELMQDYEIMRYPGKSSRFILAINRCDDAYEKKSNYSSFIVQAARTVHDTLHSVEISEIIPISARYAEYRYVLNGVEPEKTMMGSVLSRQGKSPEEIRQELERRYNTSFEYTDPHTNRLISYSTRKFLEETIGQYSTRIRYLNLARSLTDVAIVHQEALQGLQVETEMIAMLEVLGGDLMQDLMGRVNTVLHKTHTDFLEEIGKIGTQMDASRLKLAEMLQKQVLPTYEAKIGEADRKIKDRIGTEVNKMHADGVGIYYIDGLSERSRANKVIFDGLKDDLLKFDFGTYLKPGNELLNDYLMQQRKSYDEGIKKMSDCFRQLPIRTDEALDKAFIKFLQSEQLKKKQEQNGGGNQIADEVQKIYRECFQKAKKAIIDQLSGFSKTMIAKIGSDQRVSDEIDKSISRIYGFFSEFINTYHKKCEKHLKHYKRHMLFLMGRPYLKVKKILENIEAPVYPTKKRNGYIGQLTEKMLGQEADTHNSRMEKAIKETFSSFVAEASKGFGGIRSTVGDAVGEFMNAGTDQIQSCYIHIRESVELLDWQLTCLENSEPIMQALKLEDSWGQAAVLAAKEALKDTHGKSRAVYDEVSSHIRKQGSNAVNAEKPAGQGEQQ